MCVCVDRYILIQYALRYNQILSKRKYLLIVTMIWTGAFGIFTLHRAFSGNYYYDHKAFICTIDFPQDWIFTLFIISIVVTPAFTVISFCTIKIYTISKRHVQDIKPLQQQYKAFTITSSHDPITSNNICSIEMTHTKGI